jgi:CRP-like cAMP-binding protein
MANSSSLFRKASVDAACGNGNRNELLLNLPRKEEESVFSSLEFVPLPTHTVLNEMGKPIRFSYFISSGLASVLNVMSNGKTVEVGMTGKEGFVGIPLIAGFRSSPTRTIMQVEGTGYRLSADEMERVLHECPTLAKKLHQYSQQLALQAAQIAACNRQHEVEERLARWLLMSQDRLASRTFPLTQQFLAHMLGTRRASVTVAAGILQKAKLITYTRGEVKIKDRRKLEAAACECYRIMNRQSRKWQSESR